MTDVNKPVLRFKGFDDKLKKEKLGTYLNIPNKEIVNITDSSELMTVKLNLGGVYSGSNRDTLSLGSTKYYRRHAGQLIYGKQNFFNGSMAIIPSELDGKATSGDVPSFDIEHINPMFLFHYISRQPYWKSKEVEASGTGSKRIHEKTFQNFKINVPDSIKEQNKISDLFNQIDLLISNHLKEINILKKQKKGLLQKMFPKDGEDEPELRFEGFTGAWEQCKLGKLYKIYSGTTPYRGDISNYDNPKVPWVKTTDLKNKSIDINEEDISNKAANKLKLLPKNTVLVAMYGGFNQIGRTGLLTYPATINQALAALEPNEKIIPYFLITQLNFRVNDWKKVAASSRKDPNITKKDVENFSLNYPDIKEQTQIGNFFKQLDETITLQEQQLEKLKEMKKGYLQQMFI